jgi:hypothetical protein
LAQVTISSAIVCVLAAVASIFVFKVYTTLQPMKVRRASINETLSGGSVLNGTRVDEEVLYRWRWLHMDGVSREKVIYDIN